MASLYQRTMQLLVETDYTLLEIHNQANLPYYWLKKLKEGTVKDPSVNKIQGLYEFLAKRRLDV